MKVVGILGSYRRKGLNERIVDRILAGASDGGAEVEKVILVEKDIDFCANCRDCAQEKGEAPGRCVKTDEMAELIELGSLADYLILASPVNMGTATAVTKKFAERLLPLMYWPFGALAPKTRRKPDGHKKAILISSSAAPGIVSRIVKNSSFGVLTTIAKLYGAKVDRKLLYGLAAMKKEPKISEKPLAQAYELGKKIAGRR